MHTFSRCFFVIAFMFLLVACGGTRDGIGRNFDASSVRDPIPRNEPLSKRGNPESYVVFGKRYFVLPTSRGYKERGIASWYGKKFHGRETSNGEIYNMYAMTAAHKTLPLPTYVEVTNLSNGKSIVLRVNDRGPFHSNRIIDLSYTAAQKLDIVKQGTGLVEVRALYPSDRTKPVLVRDDYLKKPEVKDWRDQRHLKNRIYVQVGAFSVRQNAERMKNRLVSKDIFNTKVLLGDDNVHRVRIGPLDTVEATDNITQKLERIGFDSYQVIID